MRWHNRWWVYRYYTCIWAGNAIWRLTQWKASIYSSLIIILIYARMDKKRAKWAWWLPRNRMHPSMKHTHTHNSSYSTLCTFISINVLCWLDHDDIYQRENFKYTQYALCQEKCCPACVTRVFSSSPLNIIKKKTLENLKHILSTCKINLYTINWLECTFMFHWKNRK